MNAIRRIVHILICWLFLFATVPLQAQIRFYTQLSEKEVDASQTFQVQYIIEGSADIQQLVAPDLKDFRVLEIFENNSTTLESGTQKLVNVRAKILVLSPKRPGRFTIPGASAIIDGQYRRSNSIKVVVRPGAIAGLANGEDNQDGIPIAENSELHPGESAEAKARKNFFLRVEVNKKTCYVGECLLVTYKAYSRINASSQVLRRPSFTGFSVLEMVDAYDSRPVIERLHGLPYYMNLIRKVQLFPLQAGTFLLDPAEVATVIHFMKWEKDKSGSAGSNRVHLIPSSLPLDLKTDPVPIKVLPLPKENQPGNFSGAIGQFSISSKVMADEVRTGDLVRIQLKIEGTGNIPLLSAPPVDWPKGVDTADPQVKEEVNKYMYPLHGSKTFEYSFVAPDTGNYRIPPVELPYFDPVKKVYKVAVTEPLVMHVKRGRRQSMPAPDDKSLLVGYSPRHLYWFAVVALIILSWIGYQVYQLKKSARKIESERRMEEAGATEPTPSPDPLLAARLRLDDPSPQFFYEELQAAIWAQLAIRYQLPPSSLNKPEAEQAMLEAQVPPASIRSLFSIVDQCEWALYVPGEQPRNRQALLRDTEEMLRQIG